MLGKTLLELTKNAEAIGYVIERATPLAVRMSLKKYGRRAKYQVRPYGETSALWLDPCVNLPQVRECLIEAYSRYRYTLDKPRK